MVKGKSATSAHVHGSFNRRLKMWRWTASPCMPLIGLLVGVCEQAVAYCAVCVDMTWPQLLDVVELHGRCPEPEGGRV